MLGDWLKKWYKDRFDSAFPGYPDESNWQSIQSKMGMDWSSFWYKSNVENSEAKPKSDVWDKLNESLAISREQRRSMIRFQIRSAFVVTLLILAPFLLSDGIYTSSRVLSSPNIVQNQSTSQNVEVKLTNKISRDSDLANSKYSQLAIIDDAEFKSKRKANLTENREIGLTSEQKEIQTSINIREIELITSSTIDEGTIRPLDQIDRLATKASSTPNGKWSIGVQPRFQLSTLENPTTLLGMNSKSRITNLLSFNTAYRLQVLYNLNQRSSVSFGVVLNDRKTQRYRDFYNGKYITKELDIEYQSLHASYQRQLLNKNSEFRKFELEIELGIYIGLKTESNESWDGQQHQWLSKGLNSLDFGGAVGVNANYKITPALKVTSGIYFTNGFMNIFNGIDRLPKHFYKTYTTSFGAQFGVIHAL